MIVGFTNGCFDGIDGLHEGHRYFLTECRKHCDYLVVAINSDDYCYRVKGEGRPISPLATRMVYVRAFSEAVIPFEGREEPLIMEIRPHVVFKGHDHSPNQVHYAARVPGWKNYKSGVWTCPVIHVDRLEGYSTTELANAIRAT